jgi:hypothetical protein
MAAGYAAIAEPFLFFLKEKETWQCFRYFY